MAAALALLSAVLFGAGDFFGGAASRRSPVLVVVAISHLVGLVLILAVAPWMADEITWQDFTYGLGAGVFGIVGIGCLYHALGRGPMAVVAPVTAVSNAALPVLWGIGFGERLSGLHIAGVLLGLGAIVLISRGYSSISQVGPVTPGLIVECLVAGVGFGGFFIIMDLTAEATTPWPLVGARIVSSSIAILLLIRMRRSLIPRSGERLGVMVSAGILDMAGNLAILMAVHRGLLSLVVVLGSLYPASTVLLARYVLGEKMTRTQVVGLVLALIAVTSIVSG